MDIDRQVNAQLALHVPEKVGKRSFQGMRAITVSWLNGSR